MTEIIITQMREKEAGAQPVKAELVAKAWEYCED